MPSKSFEESVQQFAKTESEVDWTKRQEQWLASLRELWKLIRSWLAPLETARVVQVQETDQRLTERFIGTYSVGGLEVWIGQKALRFQPKGTLILGGYGRVDVEGPQGRAMLILTDQVTNGPRKGIEAASWYISYPSNRRITEQLTEQQFEKLFSSLFGVGA